MPPESPEHELLIVVPVYNEGQHLDSVLRPWWEMLEKLGISHQFLLLNDGSTDCSLEVIKKIAQEKGSSIRIVDKENSGHGASCRLGYELAVKSRCRWVLQIDSDGQCDSSAFPSFWERTSEADIIFGVRTKRDDGSSRVFISATLRALVFLLRGRDARDTNVPYRLMKRELLEAVLAKLPPKLELVNVALAILFAQDKAVKKEYLPIRFGVRSGGEGTLNLRRICQFGWGAIGEIFFLPRQ